MKYFSIAFVTFFLMTVSSFAQPSSPKTPMNHKGKFYFYWGWNNAWFTNSNIRFKGADYDFTLHQVVAKDRQTKFNFDTYFNPATISIPQYNIRFGYYINRRYSISIGTDHMKYVAKNEQTVKISGAINNSNTEYDGKYANQDIIVRPGFLVFEHTDGLNYVNSELRREDELFLVFKKIRLNVTSGIGVGMLFPRTNTTLLGLKRYDEFHVAGFGFSSLVGLNLAFGKHFFIQSELKGGYINMPDIRTTISPLDRASQDFFFTQLNLLFGVNF